MSNYLEKYLKYKAKYLALQKQIGGADFRGKDKLGKDKLEKLDHKLQECQNHEKVGVVKIHNKSECQLCPFNNAGENTIKNYCQPIIGTGDSCFYDNQNNLNRMDIHKYKQNKSNITIENNIHITEPDGEVCFGNTITSCLTMCVILDNNTKISVHINPYTNIYAYINPFKDDTQKNVLKNEEVNIFNICNKILKKIKKIDKKIKKIIILAADEYHVYKIINDGRIVLGDSSSFNTYCSDIFNDENPPKMLYPKVFEKLETSVKDFIFDKFKNYINSKTLYKKIFNIEIKDGDVYIVKQDGTGVIYI